MVDRRGVLTVGELPQDTVLFLLREAAEVEEPDGRGHLGVHQLHRHRVAVELQEVRSTSCLRSSSATADLMASSTTGRPSRTRRDVTRW